MYNVCKAFTLYNDSALPGNTETNPGEYVSFGYYDGLSVSENLFKDADHKYMFSCLWTHCLDMSRNANGTYLSQTVYAFRTDESSEEDDNFWEKDSENDLEYPFLFFSLVQLSRKSDSKISDSLQKVKVLEQKLRQKYSEMQCNIITYLTLDSSDLILVVKCRRYKIGAEIIDDFHLSKEKNVFEQCMGRNIGYCYTVASIKRDFLNDENKIMTLTDNISNVYIYMIERMPGSIQAIYKELYDTINTYGVKKSKEAIQPILGCNDEMLTLRNIPWNKFLMHYRDRIGCLNHSSKVYADNLVEVTTIIGTNRVNKKSESLKINLDKKSENLKTNSNGADFAVSGMCEKLLNKFQAVAVKYPNIAKSVTQILCSLRKFENEHFPPYLYSSLVRSVSMMVEILIEAAGNGLEDNAAECFCQCQKAFYLSVQNTGRVDRQFTQTPDFDMRMYDVPVKLVMFFIAYINEIKEYLSKIGNTDEKEIHKYEFLFCPGGAYSTQVSELFQMISKNSRIFLVEIPEHQIYNTKLMLIMLGHEVAHIVGKNIRKRDDRKIKAINISAKIVVAYMKNALTTWKDRKWKECIEYVCGSTVLWNEIENEIVIELKKFLDSDYLRAYLKEEYQEGENTRDISYKIDRLIKRSEYSTELSYLLAKGLQQILENDGDKLWERIKIRSEYYLSISSDSALKKSQHELQEKIHAIVRKIVIGDQIDAEVFSAINTIGIMMDVFSESFADLVVILITKMHWKDYIEAALVCQEQQNFKFDTTKDSEWLLRMGLVVACMDYLAGDNQDADCAIQKLQPLAKEKDQGFKKNSEKSMKTKVTTALYNFVKTYFYKSTQSEPQLSVDNREKSITSGLSVLYNGAILKEMLKYLIECTEGFDDTDKNLNRIRKMYQIFGAECEIQNEMLKMQEYIDAYVVDALKQEM